MDTRYPIRLQDIEIRGKKFQRQSPSDQYRAYCEEENCTWVGPWRSVWKDWNTTVEEVTEDLLKHTLDAHKSETDV